MGLDTVELVFATERQFDIQIPDARAAHTVTVAQLAQLVCELRNDTGRPLPYAEVLLQLSHLIAKLFDIPLERIQPESHFIHDLGLD